MPNFLCVFFLMGWCFHSPSQEKSHYFDSTLLMHSIQEFSSDSMEGRETGEAGGLKAQYYIQQRYRQLNLLQFDNTYCHAFNFANPFKKSKIKGVNLIGWIKGQSFPNKYMVISSHHDHLGIRNGEIYNGADDNASGTCALLSIAEYFSSYPPNCSIIFVAFDAEEMGLLGSMHFVSKPPVPFTKILFNLNMDMISRSKKNELFICGTHHYPQLKTLLNTVDSLSSTNVIFGHDSGSMRTEDWTFASDHGSFHKKKIPFVYLGVVDHEDYHKITDDFERIDPSFYIRSVRVAVDIAKRMDSKNAKQD